ncbi:MAG: hypothetical protein H0T50_17105 [Gemmatimonadales bacterium]|nr:hypothetical protein [Gemmatimonadales bacterium]
MLRLGGLGFAAAAASLVCGLAGTPALAQQRIAFPDGSGSITLPAGWRLTSAQRAAAEATGPEGEGVALGITMPVGPPHIAAPGVLAGPYMRPPQAFAFVTGQTGSPVLQIVALQPSPPLTYGGEAAYLLADLNHLGRPYRAFALVNTAPLQGGYWQYYVTMLLAPPEVFPRSLPVMVEIWKSWGISQGEMNRRTEQALTTMKETAAIMRGTLAERSRSQPLRDSIRGELLAGEEVLEHLRTKRRVRVTTAQMNQLFELEPGEWRVVPTHER